MFRKYILVVALIVLASVWGCGENASPLPFVTGILPDGWQKTDISGIESLIEHTLPLPVYLPSGYLIKEVYYYQDPDSTPQVTHTLLLISDKPIEWVGNQYRCHLILYIGWNMFSGGFKWLGDEPKRELIRSLPEGILIEGDGKYQLWWEYFNIPNGQSVFRLESNLKYSKDELVRIAVSTPQT